MLTQLNTPSIAPHATSSGGSCDAIALRVLSISTSAGVSGGRRGCTTMRTPLPQNSRPSWPLGIRRPVPISVMGTTGTFAFWATLNAPCGKEVPCVSRTASDAAGCCASQGRLCTTHRHVRCQASWSRMSAAGSERRTFLKAAILPSFERVPSGKNRTDAPCDDQSFVCQLHRSRAMT